MPAVPLVAVGALHEDARVAETLGKHLAADVVQPDALADVAARLLDHLVAVHVRQQPEAESANLVCKIVNCHAKKVTRKVRELGRNLYSEFLRLCAG